jgi:hypothetical protein
MTGSEEKANPAGAKALFDLSNVEVYWNPHGFEYVS